MKPVESSEDGVGMLLVVVAAAAARAIVTNKNTKLETLNERPPLLLPTFVFVWGILIVFAWC